MLSSNMILRWHVIWIWFVVNAIFVKLICCVIFNFVYTIEMLSKFSTFLYSKCQLVDLIQG